MSYREYGLPGPLLIGYDPEMVLADEHLARLVEGVVEEAIGQPQTWVSRGNPAYDPRLCLKVLVYGYATGVRSSRQLERLCRENLAFLYLSRGAAPSYHTLCTARTSLKEGLDEVWVTLLATAEQSGISRVGRITIDSTKIRADVSGESVVKAPEFDRLREMLKAILAEADAVDAREDSEGAAMQTVLNAPVEKAQMREVLREFRRQVKQEEKAAKSALGSPESGRPTAPGAPAVAKSVQEIIIRRSEGEIAAAGGPADAQMPLSLGRDLGPEMRGRIEAGIAALGAAEAEGLKHVSLTDPDARMMPEGCQKRIQECHSYEVATDNGLVVAGQATQVSADNARLIPIVEAARQHEPGGIKAVDADSGYYSGTGVAKLERAGVDTCIPDAITAGDLHRGFPVGTLLSARRGSVPFDYDSERDVYVCPQGNVLAFTQQRRKSGQDVRVYKAQVDCRECPLAKICLTQERARRRSLHIGVEDALLQAVRRRFDDPAHRDRYHHRGERVETVFGFLRATLGYVRWMLRGAGKVACEASLFTVAYQIRKVQAVRTAS
jgi:hypothetical protein